MIVPDWLCEGSLEKAKRDALVAALSQCDGNIGAAAKRLRISRSTAYRMVRDYQISVGELPPSSLSAESLPRMAGRLVQVGGEIFMVR